MLKTKTIENLTILRIIAIVAIISFSFEMTSSFFISDDIQVEIVDIDLEDDSEFDEELDSTKTFNFLETENAIQLKALNGPRFPSTLRDQHLEELPTPPPDFI